MKISAVRIFHFKIFNNPVINQAVKIFHVPRPARKQSLRQPGFAGIMPPSAACRARSVTVS
jgi:hypothetical protein